MSWLLLLLVVVVFASLAYVLHRRRVSHREDELAREQAFLMEMHEAGLMGGAGEPAATTEGAVSASTQINAPDVPVEDAPPSLPEDDATPVSGSGRGYLERSHQVVWRWLRTGLPDCEIFARGSLRRVVGRERVQKDMRLDFVICNEDFEVLAAVDLTKPGREVPAAELKRHLLSQVGVRYACWDASHLPDRATLTRWLGGSDETRR